MLTIDLGALTFMDATGLRFLWQARERFARPGRALWIVRVPASVQRLMAIAEMTGEFAFLDGSTPRLSVAC